MILYDYFRSSAGYRLRIALNLKGRAYDRLPIHLLREGGEHKKDDYKSLNPQGRVPVLVSDKGEVLIQSPAILDFIEEMWPDPPLLPRDPAERARIRAVAAIITCDIHPINNLSVLDYLRDKFGHSESEVADWYRHWIREGFEAIEQLIEPGPFSFGNSPTFADICLIPQVFNARRFELDLMDFPKISAVDEACATLDPFLWAAPNAQSDAQQ